MRRVGSMGRVGGMNQLLTHPAAAMNTAIPPHHVNPPLAQDEDAAQDGAAQDGQVGPHLDQAVAGDQLVLSQVLGQDAVLGGAEERGLCPHQEEHDDQEPDVAEAEPDGGAGHDEDLRQLHLAHEEGAVTAVREVPRRGGKEEEGEDEGPRRDVDHDAGVRARLVRQAEGDEHHEGALEEVVVEGAQELRQEERKEAARHQQGKLIFNGQGYSTSESK